MTHVVTEACIRCRYTDCVDVCPTDAFRGGRNMLVIHPDDCIDCAVCVPECPVDAIFFDADVPSTQRRFIPINAELSEDWPVITRSVAALPDADDWATVGDKAGELDRRAPDPKTTP
ncbi:MAG: ferredoxin FdxA [Hydrogenophaga sp.]|uniref:ferredoxin FdxA n=1 Tax=Hydrogenophaga sp. TaxID=1904254 RepID=UPI003D9B9233